MKRGLIIVLSLFLMIVLIGCQKAEEKPEYKEIDIPDEDMEEPVEDNSGADYEEMTPEEIYEEEVKQEVIEHSNTTEFFSGLRCNGGVQGWVTNIDEEKVELGKDVKVTINGLVAYPLDCENVMLEPGEQTYCRDLSGPLEFRKGMNKIIFKFKSKSIVELVECTHVEE